MRIGLVLILLMPASLLAQGFDIYLFDIGRDYALVKQVTNREGYDNQPAFTLDCQSLMFSSDRAGERSPILVSSEWESRWKHLVTQQALLSATEIPFPRLHMVDLVV